MCLDCSVFILSIITGCPRDCLKCIIIVFGDLEGCSFKFSVVGKVDFADLNLSFCQLICDCQLASLGFGCCILCCILYCHFSCIVYFKCEVSNCIVACRCFLFVEYIFSGFKFECRIFSGLGCPLSDYLISLLDLEHCSSNLGSSDIYLADRGLMFLFYSINKCHSVFRIIYCYCKFSCRIIISNINCHYEFS